MEGISPPQQLDLRATDLSSVWRRWIRSFNDYLLAINLVDGSAAAERRRLALFRHVGGEDVRELYSQMEFTTQDETTGAITEIDEGQEGRKLQNVIERFHTYCNPRSGVVVSRFEFHSSTQNGEAVDVFLMRLRRLSEGCSFGNQRDSLIRDKLLFGLDDKKIRDRLMAEPDDKLTLDYVVKSLRVAEAASKMSTLTLKDKDPEVSAVDTRQIAGREKRASGEKHIKCDRCHRVHAPRKCPAFGSKCNKCNKKNHWAVACKSSRVNEVMEASSDDDTAQEVYLGEIMHSDPGSWYAQIQVKTDIDEVQTIKFKLDTGAALSVCAPEHCKGKIKQTPKKLYGPGHTKLKCLGYISSQVQSGDEIVSEDIYIVENQVTPLLSRKACERLNLISVNQNKCYVEAVNVDEGLFRGLGQLQTEHSITLKDNARPFALNVPRPIPFPLRKAADEALDEMIKNQVIVKVDEPTAWVAPMVVVPKPGHSKVRICTDFTELNKFIMREIHPMSTVESSLASLGQGRVFSKIDANSGFWQIPLSEESSKLTTFLTHKGRFKYLRLPQGLSSAPEIFQAEMSRILLGIPGVVIHMDDVLVYGQNQSEHDTRLQLVLDRLLDAGMTLNKSKCEFGVDKVQFLGHIIDHEGIHAGPRLQGIHDFPRPQNVKAVRSFLGLANQFARFSKDLANATEAMRALLRKDTPWHWGTNQEESFQRVKQIFSNTPVLARYNVDSETIITTDASNQGIGATLSQIQPDGTRRLVAAASRSLNETEQRYAAIEKESLGVCWALEKFSQYILGMTNVTVETDHRPLTTLFGNMFLDRLPPRILGYKLRLQRFQFTIKHVSGKNNAAADALSRYTLASPNDEDGKTMKEVERIVNEVVHLHGLDSRLEQF